MLGFVNTLQTQAGMSWILAKLSKERPNSLSISWTEFSGDTGK
jgi:hypothetical protein